MENIIAAAFANPLATQKAIVEACHKFGQRVGKANNTDVSVTKDEISVTLHSTEVVNLTKDGKLTIYMGGWGTPTTRARINGTLNALNLGEYCVSQRKFEQYIQGVMINEDVEHIYDLFAETVVAV